MAWILTGLMTLILGVSLLSGVVSEEYDSLPSEAGGVTSASAWEEIEP